MWLVGCACKYVADSCENVCVLLCVCIIYSACVCTAGVCVRMMCADRRDLDGCEESRDCFFHPANWQIEENVLEHAKTVCR